MKVNITNSYVDGDGVTMVSFEVVDAADTVVASHTQGLAPEMERVRTVRNGMILARNNDGDVIMVRGADGRDEPHYEAGEIEDWEETGRMLPASADTVREALANYVRDVVPLRTATPSVVQGDSFDLGS